MVINHLGIHIQSSRSTSSQHVVTREATHCDLVVHFTNLLLWWSLAQYVFTWGSVDQYGGPSHEHEKQCKKNQIFQKLVM